MAPRLLLIALIHPLFEIILNYIANYQFLKIVIKIIQILKIMLSKNKKRL